MCNVIGPLEPSSNTRSLLRVAPNPRTTPCLPLRRGPAASRTTARSPAVQSWSVLSLAYATLSVPGLYPSQFQQRRKRHAVNDLHIGSIQGSATPRNADSHNRARRLVKCYVYGELCPAVQGRTESTSWSTSLPNLVYFELEDPFCSGLYPLVQEDLTGALAAMSVLTTVGDDIRDRAAVGISVVLFTTHNHSELRTMTATKLSRP